MRRYIVEINETTQMIDIYQTLPEPGSEKISVALGSDPGKRVFAVGFLASILELLPLSQFMQQPPTPRH